MSLLLASIFPVVIFLYMIYQKDHHKEPLSLLMKCLVGGCLSTMIALMLAYPLSSTGLFASNNFLLAFNDSFLGAAIPEEIAKFVVLYFLIWGSSEFNHYYDGIVYSVFVSLGFALVENLLYVFQGGMGVAIARAIFAVPGHGLDAVLMGYYFSLAKFHQGQKRKKLLAYSLIFPILFHGAYDFLLFAVKGDSPSAGLIVIVLVLFAVLVIFLWRKCIGKIKKHLETDNLLINNSGSSSED
jgi:RsiW-degrading membrane proteinase PrsW (M82 family)